MKHSKKTKEIIQLSNTIAIRLRRLGCYNGWKKRDFVVCQAKHEGTNPPNSTNHTANWELLCRFAERCDLDIPTKKGKKRRKPNTTYDGKRGFTKWRKLRYEALVRSKGSCDCCGSTPATSGGPLHVDHIKPKSIYPELQWKLSNLQVLCADCNIGKGNWEETNWYEIRENENAEQELDAELILEKQHLLN